MPSIRDIAQAAGVSISTVSKSLNGKGRLSAATRKRVRDIAARLDYQPNAFARGLAGRGSDNLGFLIDRAPDRLFSNPFYSVVLEGLEAELVQHGFNLLISAHVCTLPDAPLPTFVRSGIVGGLILAGRVDPGFLQRLEKLGLPAVLVDNHLERSAFDSVNTDNHGGAEEMMRHLMTMGHRRIGFLLGTNGHSSIKARYEAYRRMMRRHGSATKKEWVGRGDVTTEGGREAMRQIHRAGRLPTAIFASNDAMAIGAIQYLHQQGVRVPETVSVSGFDNIFLAAHTHPPLTTMDVNKIEMGRIAAQRLMRRMADPSLPVQETILQARLVVRESVRRGNARVPPEARA